MPIQSNLRRLAVPLAIVLLLVCAAVLGASVFVPTGIAAATAPSLVSGSCDGGAANGNSQQAAVSADGQFVAFYSDGTNLVPSDTNGQHDAFIRDRASGAVELLNVSSDGQLGNGESAWPRPSGDGRYVTFHSWASNLVPGDTNERADVFVRDRVLGTTERVSVASDGSEANAESGGQVITPDGRYVVFVTFASNLSSLDTQSDSLDIYLHDRQTGETELVSLAQDGTRPYIFESQNPSVSDDGRYIAFESRAQLVADDTNYDSDVYVRDRLAGTTTRISTPPGGGNANSYSWIRLGHGISGDGRYIAFESGSTDLVASDTNGWADVFIHDQTTGTTTLLSVAADGSQGDSVSATAAISGDGTRVAFFSVASNLLPGDTNAIQDVFVRDWPSGELELVNVTEGGGQFSVNTAAPSLSRDGSVIAYLAAAGTPYGGADSFTDILVNATINCAPTATVPSSPTSATAAAGDGQASVSWAAPASDGGSPITSYTVTSSPDGVIATTAGATTTANVTGLTNGTSYTFTVTATNAIGTGPASLPSNAVTPIAKGNQTITFGAPPNRTMLQSPVTVSASASSGLPVFFATTTLAVCTSSGANGQTITLVGAGTCTVRADQPGNEFFNPAPSATRSFTVSRVNQTITFGVVANKTLAQTPFTVSATASSGLTVTFTSTTPTVCTNSGINGTTVDLLSPGSCTIVASEPGNATYNAALDRPRTFTVTFAGQTITFPNITTKTMVQSPVTATATASSGLPVTFTTSTPAVCTPGGTNGSTITLVAPGSCAVLADQAGNGTYAPATQRSRTFTVNLTTQTITFANPGAKTLAQSPLTVGATTSSGLPVAFTAVTPAVCISNGTTGSTITFLTTGACTVVAAQPGNANYAPATSVTRTFTVSQAPQTITFGALQTANLLQSPLTVSATASSGLTVTFTTSSASVCTAGGANGATITLLKVGTCRVVASQAGNATYRPAANVTRSFTVTTAKLAQTITFAALGSRSIGAPPLTLAATASSGLAVSYLVEPASASTCSVAGSVLTLHDPGTCTITASQAGNASFLAAPPVTQDLTATLEGFVQASGASLVLDGQPFEIFGANIYQTSNFGHTADPDQVFGWAADARLNTLRLTDIFNQTTNDPTAPYREADWQWIDGLIARAGDGGMKVILDFSSYRNWLVWSSQIDNGWLVNCQPNQDRTPVDYTLLDPYTVAHRADWTTFMTFVANRVNTVTGITYRNDPTILVVSIAGEPVGPGWGECGKASSEQELTDFFEWALAEWKSLDPHHLRSTGGLHGTYAGLDGNGDPIPSGQLVDGIALFRLADNTLPSLHTYPPQTTSLPLADGQTPVLAPVAQALGKPWFTEEFGFRQEETDSFRATEFDAIYDAQIAYGSSGSLFWNLGPEIGVGTFDVNPSTPLTWARILAEAP